MTQGNEMGDGEQISNNCILEIYISTGKRGKKYKYLHLLYTEILFRKKKKKEMISAQVRLDIQFVSAFES